MNAADQTASTTAQTVTATTHSETTPTTVTMSLSAFPASMCLLKTAIANVSAGQTTIEGQILFDEGAQHSFITQDLAN